MYRMKTKISIKTLIVVFIMTAVALTSCNRYRYIYDDGVSDETKRLGRPVLRNNSVHTAWGTPIRGTSVAGFMYYDGDGVIQPRPTKEDYGYIMKAGINTLQLKLEDPRDGLQAGYRVEICDRIVDEAEQLGLYLILCVHAMNGDEENFDKGVRFINDFWNFYAPRYKDRKHVIYEICNEFYRHDEELEGFNAVIEGQASAYRTIRQHAPETVVILWSFAMTYHKWRFPVWMRALEEQITGGTKNVAVGIHSYETEQDYVRQDHDDHWGAEGLRSVIHTFTGLGYPVINTEVPARSGTQYIDETLFPVLESEGIAWISSHFDLLSLPSHWHGGFEAAGIAWTPDYGDWPRPDAHYPFKTSDGGGISLFNDVATLSRLNFGAREPLRFVAEAEADGAGIFEIRLKDGTVVGSCPVSSGIDSVKVPILKPVNGIADLVLAFRADIDGRRLRLRNWRFELPQRAVHQNIYRRVYFADYPYRTGAAERGYNTDPASNAPLNLRKIRHGDVLTFDFIRFNRREIKNLHLRARTLAGGTVKVIVGRFTPVPYIWRSEIGRGEIQGARGAWADFVIPVNLDDDIVCLEPWDLTFIFESSNGAGSSAELFELSEFVFK